LPGYRRRSLPDTWSGRLWIKWAGVFAWSSDDLVMLVELAVELAGIEPAS
jgi:hypothetical protein